MDFKLILCVCLGFMLADATAVSLSDCPANLARDRYLFAHGSSCYLFVIGHEREYPTAERECESRGGHLVVIKNAETQNFLYSTLRHAFNYNDILWIGLSDRASEKHWVWVDGTPAGYTHWASGQPGLGSSFEDCAGMDMDDGGRWHDFRCEDFLFISSEHYFVCEYPVVKHTTTTTTTTERPTTSTTTHKTTTSEPTTQRRTTITSTERMTTATPTQTERMTTATPTQTERMTTATPTQTERMTTATPTPTERMTTATPTPTERMTTATPTPTERMTTPETPEPTPADTTTMSPTTTAETPEATPADTTTMAPTDTPTTTAPPTTTTPMPTTVTTPLEMTTQKPTTTTTTPLPTARQATTVSPTTNTGCHAPFACTLDCGLSGYQINDQGCMICQCDD